MKTNLKILFEDINSIDLTTNWHEIAKEVGIEKQIEIRAELLRAIKRIDKELKK